MSSHWGSLLLFQVILEVKLYLVLHTMFFNSQVHLEHFSSSFFKLTSLCPRFSWKALSQGSIGGLFYVNFMIDQFSYLNITSIGQNLIQDENDCGYACLKIPFTLLYTILDRKGTQAKVSAFFNCSLIFGKIRIVPFARNLYFVRLSCLVRFSN